MDRYLEEGKKYLVKDNYVVLDKKEAFYKYQYVVYFLIDDTLNFDDSYDRDNAIFEQKDINKIIHLAAPEMGNLQPPGLEFNACE